MFLLQFICNFNAFFMLTFDLWPLQAADSRDSLAMKLYAQCFKWIIQKINNRIKGFGTYCSIGVLDIFGFENFEVSKPSTLDDDTALEFSVSVAFKIVN